MTETSHKYTHRHELGLGKTDEINECRYIHKCKHYSTINNTDRKFLFLGGSSFDVKDIGNFGAKD